jgi:hypothetical protein
VARHLRTGRGPSYDAQYRVVEDEARLENGISGIGMELDQLAGPLCIAAVKVRSPDNNPSQVAEATASAGFAQNTRAGVQNGLKRDADHADSADNPWPSIAPGPERPRDPRDPRLVMSQRQTNSWAKPRPRRQLSIEELFVPERIGAAGGDERPTRWTRRPRRIRSALRHAAEALQATLHAKNACGDGGTNGGLKMTVAYLFQISRDEP